MSRDHLSGPHAALIASGHCESHTTFELYLPSGTTRLASANASTNAFTSVAHALTNGQAVALRNDGEDGWLPTPLQPATVYFVVGATADTFQLATVAGGAAIDIGWAGYGTHSVIPVSVLRYATAQVTIGTNIYQGALLQNDALDMSLLRAVDGVKLKVQNVDKAIGQTITGAVNAMNGAIGILGVVHIDGAGVVYYDTKIAGEVLGAELDETANPPFVSFTFVADVYHTTITGITFAKAFPFTEPAPPESRPDPDDIADPGPHGRGRIGDLEPPYGRYPYHPLISL